MSDAAGLERRTRVAAYCLCRDDSGRFLLCRSRRWGWWTLPGGGVEWAEEPARAALRELTEETGLCGEIDGILGAFSTLRTRPDGQTHAISIVYRASVVGGERRDETAGSTDRSAWLSPEEIDGVELDGWVAAALALA